mmetsp:Transcript_47200/g.90095  ORF Transcript_47200/g.90095 Transcript_47200/m.90095 type:complete len:296 (-) Transcript_47200:85-972(-)
MHANTIPISPTLMEWPELDTSIMGSSVICEPANENQYAVCSPKALRSFGISIIFVHCCTTVNSFLIFELPGFVLGHTMGGTCLSMVVSCVGGTIGWTDAGGLVGMVSFNRSLLARTSRAYTPPTERKVPCTPKLFAIAPPMAGPTAVPPAKPAVMGAIVRARLRGVLMSEMYIPAPVVSMATPMPEIARQTNNSSKLDANPIPPTPIPRTPSPYVSSGFRPYLSQKCAQGTLASSLTREKTLVSRPNWPVLSPMSLMSSGSTGVMTPIEVPVITMHPAMLYTRGSTLWPSSTILA